MKGFTYIEIPTDVTYLWCCRIRKNEKFTIFYVYLSVNSS